MILVPLANISLFYLCFLDIVVEFTKTKTVLSVFISMLLALAHDFVASTADDIISLKLLSK